MSASSSSSSAAASKLCFNSQCENLKAEPPRRGWRLRCGEFAQLCDRCAVVYEEGRFCETFHFNASGWRCCQSCAKRVHCGCIVSVYAFILLDHGGIECVNCARKNVLYASNHARPPSLFCHVPGPERHNDLPAKSWSNIAGSGPVPWQKAASSFNSSTPFDLHRRVPYNNEISMGIDRLRPSETSSSSMEKMKIDCLNEKLRNGSLEHGSQETLENGNAGIKSEDQSISCLYKSRQCSSINENQFGKQFGLTLNNAPTNKTLGKIEVSASHLRTVPQLPNQLHDSLQNGVESASRTQSCKAKPQLEARERKQLHPRCWPGVTDQLSQKESEDSNSRIKPLFEKILTASDAGKVGRLVLPKRCAEAFLPPISRADGLPLEVQDSKGKDWKFQFRFWPNNNSRMYVLEGVTPCIQNMQMQAGDIVTFGRLEPEGKLVMGCRKASADLSSDQADLADPTRSEYVVKEAHGGDASLPKKRKNSTMGSKSKRLRIEAEDLIELKLTWEEAQGLFRPPPNHVPTVVAIEGFDFEEYEDAPIIGKPTILATDDAGNKVQWVQCEDCKKWRKLPANILLPSKWTCSHNLLDPERSFCGVAQELTEGQFESLLCHSEWVASTKMKASKHQLEYKDASEGLDALANLAVLGEGEALPTALNAATEHPCHRPGCSCIVCIQPPSGKGSRHKDSCTCDVCLAVKHQRHTLTLRQEKKQSDEVENTEKTQPQQLSLHEKSGDDDIHSCRNATSLLKGHFDLNIQPEREEDLLSGSNSGNMVTILQDANDESHLMQQRLSTIGTLAGNQAESVEGGLGEKLSNGVRLGSNHRDVENHTASVITG